VRTSRRRCWPCFCCAQSNRRRPRCAPSSDRWEVAARITATGLKPFSTPVWLIDGMAYLVGWIARVGQHAIDKFSPTNPATPGTFWSSLTSSPLPVAARPTRFHRVARGRIWSSALARC
jgi:hypothetical protein